VIEQQELNKEHLEKLFGVVQRSFPIVTHMDLFMWLQQCVSEFLPHDVLVAAWGDFTTGQLKFDVASNVPEIRTQKAIEGCDVLAPLMGDLFHRWVSNGERWYIINNFDVVSVNTLDSDSFMSKLEHMKSVLVYGIRDLRGNDDTLYVFFDKSNKIRMPQYVMGMLMPHIDAALRRVECLAPVITEEDPSTAAAVLDMSEREHEILHWVTNGKTNSEIGTILGISPNTVKNHLKRIFLKLEVYSRAQAVAKYNAISQ
jgi:transcriptional regulator EpsA